MQLRRERILAMAQLLLGEAGVEGFTIRELGRRAGVAPRTLYNALGGKADIIAAAIEEHFSSLLAEAPPQPRAGQLESVLQRIDLICDAVVQLQRYAAAMVGAYFNPASDPRVRESLVRINQGTVGSWVRQANRERVLSNLSEKQLTYLEDMIRNAMYANVGDFVSGRIAETVYRERAQLCILLIPLTFFRPTYRSQVAHLIEKLLGDRAEEPAEKMKSKRLATPKSKSSSSTPTVRRAAAQ